MRVDYKDALTRHRFDLFYLDTAVAGLIETVLLPDHLWIENIAVHPQQQGRGIGSLLLSHAEAQAADAGVRELRLVTNGAFESNVALYLRRGYGIARTEPFMGGTAVHMTKVV